MTAPASRQSSPEELSRALDLLPSREFRFVDRILQLSPGQSGQTEYLVRGDEPFLPGHFPGEPLFPGVLLLEAAAQLAAVVIRTEATNTPSSELRTTALRSVKILGTARPGQTVRVEVRVTARRDNTVQAQVSARVDGEVVLTGELTLGPVS